jgi:xanthine/CO dehydrogenase XdhC/CoxF family maturation factor
MRSELPHLIALARRLLDHGEPATLATLISASTSSYRSLGSLLVGGPPGLAAGGVSGGCLEEYIIRHGRQMMLQHSAVLLSFATGNAADVQGAQPILGCGGSIEVLIERLTHSHLQYLQHLASAHDSDVASLATSTIEPAGDTAVTVCRRWEPPADPLDRLAGRALRERRSYCALLRGGGRALLHYIPPLTRLVIFGAGDDVRPVCDLAHSLGWHLTIADSRARRARPDNFPSADRVIAEPWEAAVEQIRFTPSTAVVLMTHSLTDDAALLPLLADKPSAYAGVLGPVHRRDALLHLAAQAGPMNEAFVSRLRGPIGLDLGDRSAAGIAVSLISEILTHLHDRQARPLSDPAAPHRTPTAAAHA